MKKILILALSVILALVAGCTTASPGNSLPVASAPATPQPTLSIPSTALPMNGTMILGNATHQITASIDSFEVNPQPDGKQTLTIYVAARNTGKDPIKFVWFSKLTDLYGNTYGGIGLSHGGNGARSAWIMPNFSELARDYVTVDNSNALADLNKGAILDVWFMEQKMNVTPTLIPDYHVTWVINPGSIV